MSRRSNPLRHPSRRNLLVYHELVLAERTQVEVAEKFHMTQPRVSQVCARVQQWVDGILVGRLAGRGTPGRRLHLAVAVERKRLLEAYQSIMLALGDEDDKVRYVRRSVELVRGEPVYVVEELQTEQRWLSDAHEVATRLGDLEAVARLGPFLDVPEQLLALKLALQVEEAKDVAPVIRGDDKGQIAANRAEREGRGVILAASQPAPNPSVSSNPAATYGDVASGSCGFAAH